VYNQGHKTGGRQKGSRNKSTQEREETAAKVVEAIGEMIPDAFAGDAHAFLVPRTVTRNEAFPGKRFGILTTVRSLDKPLAGCEMSDEALPGLEGD